MPELPEVETVRRSLEPRILGSHFTGANLLRDSALHPLSLPLKQLTGLRIDQLKRRGKLLLFSLSAQELTRKEESLPSFLVIHLRMTGRILTAEANARLGKHTRCVFSLLNSHEKPFQIFFDDIRTFGKILLANQQILQNWDLWLNMGPEPFELEAGDLKKRLKGQKSLKTALLDQHIVAGIGNIYADEALFAAGLDPFRPAGSISDVEAENLTEAIKRILRNAIEQGGSSIRDYLDADGKKGNFQKSFAVYGRGGQNCPKCGGILEKKRLGGRATVFCLKCQK